LTDDRTTANLPADLLAEATAITGEGITATIVRGLELVRRSRAAEKGRALRGKLHIDIDLNRSRERPHR
jgi:hypothetical protein